jgi:hypothetical protein
VADYLRIVRDDASVQKLIRVPPYELRIRGEDLREDSSAILRMIPPIL